MTTMTKVAKFNALAEMVGTDAVFEDGTKVSDFLAHEVEMTNKRNARKSVSPTKAQKENAEIKTKILDTLADASDGMTASEVAKALGLNSPQKATALLKQLIDEGKVTRGKVGKATMFTVA